MAANFNQLPRVARRLGVLVAGAAFFAVAGTAHAALGVTLERTVTEAGSSCAGATELTVTTGQQVKVCYKVNNTSTVEVLTDFQIIDRMGTASRADDVVLNWRDLVGTFNSRVDDVIRDDLRPNTSATAEVLVTYATEGTFRSVASVRAGWNLRPTRTVTGVSVSTVYALAKARNAVFTKTVTRASGSCPGLPALTGIRSGDDVKYCYSVTNIGDFDLTGIRLLENNGTPGAVETTLTGLQNLDGNGGNNDLAPGATAYGELVQNVAVDRGRALNAAAAFVADGIRAKRAVTRLTVELAEDAACSLEVKVTSEQDTFCTGAQGSKVFYSGGPRSRVCYRVTNDGSIPLTNASIRDNTFGTGAASIIAAGGTGPIAPGASSEWESKIQPNSGPLYKDHVGIGVGVTQGSNRLVSCAGDGATALRWNPITDENGTPIGIIDKRIMLTNGNCATATTFDNVSVPSGSIVYYCYHMYNQSTTRGWPEPDAGKILDAGFYLADPGVKNGILWQSPRSLAPGEERWFKSGPIRVTNTRSTTAYLHSPQFHRPDFGTYYYVYDNATASIQAGDLRLTKTVTSNGGSALVDTGSSDEATFRVNVANISLQESVATRVFDFLPANVEFVSATASQGACLYQPTLSRIFCNLLTIPGRGEATVDITLRIKGIYGTMSSNTCAYTTMAEVTRNDNCARTPVTFYSGPTRTTKFWENNAAAMGACTAGGPINVGIAVIDDETVDNEIDATLLPLSGVVTGDGDATAETATQLALGLMNANSVALSRGNPRTLQAQACVVAGQELLAANCNQRVFGATGPLLQNYATALRTACFRTNNATTLAQRIRQANTFARVLRVYNANGTMVPVTNYGASTPLTLDEDDPTDNFD